MPESSTPPTQIQSQDVSIVRPLRRFLLFQLNFTGPQTLDSLIPRWMAPGGLPDKPVAVSDVGDYDAPQSDIYWRNVLRLQSSMPLKSNPQLSDTQYNILLASHFNQFMADIYTGVAQGTISLRRDNSGNPYIDLSPYVRTSTSFSTSAGDLANKLTLMLGRQDLIYNDQVENGTVLNDVELNNLNGILPRENDAIMVLTQYPGETTYKPEYIGFVKNIRMAGDYNSIDAYEFDVEGISKITKESEIIRQRSISTEIFLPGIEISNDEQIAPHSDNFNDKDIQGVFSQVIQSVYSFIGSSKSTGVVAGLPSYSQSFYPDPNQFLVPVVLNPNGASHYGIGKSQDYQMAQTNKAPLQHNFFTLMTLFLMTITEFNDGDTLFSTRTESSPDKVGYYAALESIIRSLPNASTTSTLVVPANDKNVLLSPFNRMLLEHGDHEVYNRMVASNYSLFYPHLAKAAEILGDIRTTAFYDVFESRDGVIICRPARYNKIEQTIDEAHRINVVANNGNTAGLGGLGPQSASAFNYNYLFQYTINPPLAPGNGSFEFNPDSNFFIPKDDMLDVPDRNFDSSSLDSRADLKLLFPYAGQQDFPSGVFIDPDVLLRFGLKSKGPISNPNALNSDMPILFAPMALAMNNAPARTASITVKDSRRYYVGKLYYIEAIDCVGHLVQDDIVHLHSNLSARKLSFTMVRRVVRRAIADVLNDDDLKKGNEILNIGMCYFDDPPGDDVSVQQYAQSLGVSGIFTPSSKRQVLIQATKALLTQMKGDATTTTGAILPTPNSGQNNAMGTMKNVNGPKIAVFRYIPTILDLMLELEEVPSSSKPNANKSASTPNQPASNNNGTLIAPVVNGYVDMVYGFKQSQNQQFYDQQSKMMDNIVYMNGFAAEGDPEDAFYSSKSAVPPAGAVYYNPNPSSGYGITADASDSNKNPINGTVYYETGPDASTSPSLIYAQTPFYAASLSSVAQNLSLSQLLVNKLAGVDLSMKYYSDAMTSNPDGIPQLYTWDGQEFHLFAPVPVKNPNAYVSELLSTQAARFQTLNIMNTSGGEGSGESPLYNSWSGSNNIGIAACPSCLSWTGKGVISNSAYQIVGNADVYNVPFGHIMASGRGLDTAAFYRVQSKLGGTYGGKIKLVMTGDGLTAILSAADKNTVLTREDTGETVASIQLPLSVYAKAIYFLTPFAEPTIERLLNFPIPPSLGGQQTQADAYESSKTVSKVLTANNRQAQGDAILLSPDFLAAQSGSDLQVWPEKTSVTAPNPDGSVWDLFETAVENTNNSANKFQGFWRQGRSANNTGVGGAAEMNLFPGSLTVNVTAADGTILSTRKCSFYRLQIVDATATPGVLTDDQAYSRSQTTLSNITTPATPNLSGSGSSTMQNSANQSKVPTPTTTSSLN